MSDTTSSGNTGGASGVCGDVAALRSLTEAARATWEAENRAAAARFTACYRLFRECVRRDEAGAGDGSRPGYAVIDPFVECAGQVVAAMPISSGRAEAMISFAVDLTERYPAILAALTAGRMEQRAAELLARQMSTVDPAILDQVQQAVVQDYLAALDGGERLGARTIQGAADAIIRRFDPDGIRQRKADAARDRGLHLRKGTDGMSNLWATLAADEAAILAEHLDHRVAELTNPTSDTDTADLDTANLAGYPLPQRRADALMSLVCGDRGRTTDTAAPLRPRITVFAPADGSDPQVQFPRTGESAIHALLALLATSHGATLDRIDPTPGAADDAHRALDYRPSAALARRIRLRDGTCRHPGCTVAADYCDLDHCQPFDHNNPNNGGHTTEDNLMCLCRRHHRLKTFSGWLYDLSPDGTLVVITPDGATMLTRPSGPLAAYRREHTHTEQHPRNTPHISNHSDGRPKGGNSDSPEAEPTYWHRRAARLRTERSRTERTGPGRHTTPRSRWWDRNQPTPSPIERHIQKLLDEHLNPPPF